ncbi:MAG: NarK/NasA family nitrate transporter [Bacteroidetes bacterium]|nr:NarK/NasA family nitrate transporter [Bacteroidota bacterium]MBV6461126.1 Nitrate/nitrite transporter NarK [Flavobacteriales bacterium]WKZ75475.1 MAG: MFS transporter [Vicingaceae bacterium]MCL4815043.1 MFS transporter [Flavobacteriales bacterium]NOG94850.1 NarK/NasA family nitrate transporter [Bacteroidota bacterium]
MATWLTKWEPENKEFWDSEGSKIAWKVLTVTTISLILSFATWFMMSAIVTKLPGIGFKFDKDQLFWLAAMPGLAAGLLRIVHTFLLPIYGSRHVISISTIIKLIPAIGLGLAVMNTTTPFWVFMVIAFTAGFGGGDFSSYMPSTSLFFPKRLQGTALGIQAGIGNFGVSVAQFMTPAMLGVATYGAAQVFTKTDPKTGEVLGTSEIYLQSAALWYVPLLVILAIASWYFIKSIPVKASFKEQLDIFGDKHTWFCTITYVMTFGGFSGLAAIFPLMIKTVYGNFPDAPDALKYAFLGPLIGASSRVLFGFIADKVGGAILTTLTGIGLIIGCVAMVQLGLLTPTSVEQFPAFLYLMLFLFFITGMGNAATFRQYPIIFGHNPRQAAGVIGFTAAIAAFGPFIFATSVSAFLSSTGNANGFFYTIAGFFVIATIINWWYYNRKGCERPS